MRTINANLTSGQTAISVAPTATLTIGGTTYTSRLLSYKHRIAANRARTSEILLSNVDSGLNNSPPTPGDTVTISRGLTVDGTTYTADLPRLWVESIEYHRGYLTVNCIDFWSLLYHWRAESNQTWSSTSITTIVDWILTQVNLTRSGTLTSLTLDYSIPKGQRGDIALRRLCAKIPEYPYHGLAANVKFKTIVSTEQTCYTYGWQPSGVDSHHPYHNIDLDQSAWDYNKITVTGATTQSTTYTGSDQDATQITNVGTRFKHIVDENLTSNAECQQRAQAELDYYEAQATRIQLTANPTHGLEIYDQVAIATTPWSGTSYTARIAEITETYGLGSYEQTLGTRKETVPGTAAPQAVPGTVSGLNLIPTADNPTDDLIETGHLQDHTITDDDAALSKIADAALSARSTIGAVLVNTSAYTAFITVGQLENAFYNTLGRVPRIGDAFLAEDSGTFRLYVYESTAVNYDRWVYFTADGSVVRDSGT
jgi:hypothetical protein